MFLYAFTSGFVIISVISMLLATSVLIIAWNYYPVLSPRRKNAVTGLVIVAFSFLLIAGLLSFSVNDSHLLESETKYLTNLKLGNWMGLAGHYSAGFFFRLLGVGAFLVPGVLLLLGADLVKPFIRTGRLVFVYVLMIGVLAVVSIIEKVTKLGLSFDSTGQEQTSRLHSYHLIALQTLQEYLATF